MKERNRRPPAAAALAAAALLAAGCGLMDSEDVRTDDIWAWFKVEHDPLDRVTGWAELRAGGPIGRILDLTGGDYVECNGTRLTEYTEPVTDYHWLEAAVPIAVDGRYRFELIRPGGGAWAAATMTAKPTITGTEPAGEVRRSDHLTVRWDATEPGGGVDIEVDGDCVNAAQADDETDDGEYTFPMLSAIGTGDCTITVTVDRYRSLLITSGFQAGLIEVHRMDAVVLSYRGL